MIRNQKVFFLFLAALRHAHLTNKLMFVYPYSSVFLCTFLNTLVAEGLISGWSFTHKKNNFNSIRVTLRYLKTGVSAYSNLRVYSSPGNRYFFNKYKLMAYSNKNPSNIIILSTSRGILSGNRALAFGIGGEVLCCFY